MLRLFFATLLFSTSLASCSMFTSKECQYDSVWLSIYGEKPNYQDTVESIKAEGDTAAGLGEYTCNISSSTAEQDTFGKPLEDEKSEPISSSPNTSQGNTPEPPKLSYKSSCGDEYKENMQWFRVVGDESQFTNIKNNYCGDVLKRGNKIQIASFTTQFKAEEFANKLSDEIGIQFWTEQYNEKDMSAVDGESF